MESYARGIRYQRVASTRDVARVPVCLTRLRREAEEGVIEREQITQARVTVRCGEIENGVGWYRHSGAWRIRADVEVEVNSQDQGSDSCRNYSWKVQTHVS